MSQESQDEAPPGSGAPGDAPGSADGQKAGATEQGTGGYGTGPTALRRLYDWVLHWADTRYGVPALFLISFAESSFFPIPPDPLLLALCLGAARRSLRFAAVCTIASVTGGMAGYAIGAGAWHLTRDFFFTWVPGVTPEAFEGIRAFYDANGFAAVFLAGLSPIPYKVFTLSSGVFGINFGVFLVASLLSRGFRFFLVAGLVYRFGAPIERFINQHFDRLVIVFSVLFVGGFLVIKLLL